LSPFLNLSIAALTSSQQEAASQHISSNRNRSYSGKKQSHPIRNHVEYRQRRTKEWYERRRLQIIRQTLHSTVGEKERRVRWRRKYAQMAQSALVRRGLVSVIWILCIVWMGVADSDGGIGRGPELGLFRAHGCRRRRHGRRSGIFDG